MKINIRKSSDRGITRLDWLDSKHGFSFGNYYNPENTNFKELIVLNEDWIEAGEGFGMHHHDNAEVVSIVLKGELLHEDSEGNKGVIVPGEVQRMSAGTGIMHSEFASKKEDVHLLQIWLKPRTKNTKPSYEQKIVKTKNNELSVLVSGNNKENKEAVFINQDTKFLIGTFTKLMTINHKTSYDNAYLFVVSGSVSVEKNLLSEGDAAEIEGCAKMIIRTEKDSKFLLIEMK